MTPASPWIGSTRKATVLGPMARSSASASPYGTTLKPGAKGPKLWRDAGSVEKPMMASVRPWKLSWQTTISALPSGTPLTS